MEAALADCTVVVSIAGHELEYVRDLAYYCDPADAGSIRDAVVEAYENDAIDETPRRLLKERILTEYTWQRTGELTHQAYRRVLEHEA